ncbi:MAG: hypothetical protein ACRDUX_34825, partial [Mycobacterium sp.]
HCTVDDVLWTQLRNRHSDEAILELLMLAGTYRMISYLANGLQLPLEPGARRFPQRGGPDATCHSVSPASTAEQAPVLP